MSLAEPLQTEFAAQHAQSLPGRLACFAREWPSRTALREKHRGLWRPISWAAYWNSVCATAAQFEAWGLGAGDRVAILSGNRPEWLYADLAIQMLGGLSAGVYETSPEKDAAYVINHSRARVAVCEDQEQVDKVLACLDQLPTLEHIVVIDPRGTHSYTEFRLSDWDDLLRVGSERFHEFDALGHLAALKGEAAAMIIYTSGTTGQPKGALLSHHGALATVPGVAAELGLSGDDSVLSYLPLCHVAEKIYTIFTPLTVGSVVHFGESIDTVRDDLAEVAPTAFLGVPRIWEKLNAGIAVKMQDASWLKRTLYQHCLRSGEALARRQLSGQPQAGDGLRRALIDRLVFAALRERIGLNRCRLAFSGAAPVAPELLAWFTAIGVTVVEGYGLTESSGISHYNRPDRIRLGTVGQPAEDVECRIAEDGEILVRGACVFMGYLDNDEATREAIDAEGWLHTGDVGSVDEDGYLTITGRKKEIMITAGGKNLSPAKIENTLKTSPYIKEVVAIGDTRAYVSALIQIDGDMVGNWATQRRLPYTSFSDLSAQAEVRKLIQGEVDRLNGELARVEQVRRFALLSRELNQDDGELTATQKVRRKNVLARYAEQVEGLYG